MSGLNSGSTRLDRPPPTAACTLRTAIQPISKLPLPAIAAVGPFPPIKPAANAANPMITDVTVATTARYMARTRTIADTPADNALAATVPN